VIPQMGCNTEGVRLDRECVECSVTLKCRIDEFLGSRLLLIDSNQENRTVGLLGHHHAASD